MAELADALDLGSSAVRRAGSSPVPGTSLNTSVSNRGANRLRTWPPQRAHQRFRRDHRKAAVNPSFEVGIFLRAGKQVSHQAAELPASTRDLHHSFEHSPTQPFSGVQPLTYPGGVLNVRNNFAVGSARIAIRIAAQTGFG